MVFALANRKKTAISNNDENCILTLLLVTYFIAEYQGRGNTHYTLSARFIKKSSASRIDAESIGGGADLCRDCRGRNPGAVRKEIRDLMKTTI